MREQYSRLISGYEALLNKTEFIPSRSIDNSPIQTMAEILETLMIQCTEDSNWFNGPIINIPAYTKLIIEVSFPNDFRRYLTEMESKLKQLLVINKFKRFFEKAYKIRATAAIPGLSRLIHDDPSLDLTWTHFCRNGWLENMENPYLLNFQLLMSSLPKYTMVKGTIKNLTTITFRPLQDDEPSSEASDLAIVKKKLVVVATNPLMCYIFLKVYL